MQNSSLWTFRLLVFFSILEVMLFGGLPFGWVSLIFILKEENIFTELCVNYNEEQSAQKETFQTEKNDSFTTETNFSSNQQRHSCDEQDARLNLLFSVTLALIVLGNAYIGFMFEKLGTVVSRCIHSVLFLVGSALVAMTSMETPWLILPGMIMIGLSGFALLVSSTKVSIMLKKRSAAFIGAIQGSFHSSSIILLFVKILYEYGISMKYSFFGIAGVFVIVSSICTTLQRASEKSQVHMIQSNSSNTPDLDAEIAVASNGNITTNDSKEHTETSAHTTGLSFYKLLLTKNFLLQQMWVSVNILRFLYFLGVVNYQLEILFTAKNEVSEMTDILAYMMLCGFATACLTGLFLHWLRITFKRHFENDSGSLLSIAIPLCMTSILGLALSVVSFYTSHTAFYISFILMVLLRSFVYTVNMAFIVTMFPAQSISVVFGINMSLCGLFSLLQYPLFLWTETSSDAYIHVNIFFICLSVVSFAQPINIFIQARRQRPV